MIGSTLCKSYAAHRRAFALRKGDLSFFDMRQNGIFGILGYIAMGLSAAFCLLGGQWFWSMPWHLIVAEFAVISVAILGFGVAGMDTLGRMDHMWKMKRDPVYRKEQEEHDQELSKWLGETEWMVDATREINKLATSCRKGTDSVKHGRKCDSDSIESSPKLRIVDVSDVA